jgi:hypothetical protein
MIFGPKPDATYVVEFRISKAEPLAISVPRGEAAAGADGREHKGAGSQAFAQTLIAPVPYPAEPRPR